MAALVSSSDYPYTATNQQVDKPERVAGIIARG
jgi:hypothetical protein